MSTPTVGWYVMGTRTKLCELNMGETFTLYNRKCDGLYIVTDDGLYIVTDERHPDHKRCASLYNGSLYLWMNSTDVIKVKATITIEKE